MRYIVIEQEKAVLFPDSMSYQEIAKGRQVHSAGVCTLEWDHTKGKIVAKAFGSSVAEEEVGAYARIGDDTAIEFTLNTARR